MFTLLSSLALVPSMETAAKNFNRITTLRLLLENPNNEDNPNNQLFDRILATVFVAMSILIIILFLICKFCFRRPNDSENENPASAADPKPSIDVELEAIPVIVFRSETNLPSSPSPSSSRPSSELESCAICLEEYVNGDRVRVLPRCKHVFHKSCIEEWLQVPSLHCPICRDRILDHRLQSVGSNNCRNQTNGGDNPISRMLHIPFPPLPPTNLV